MLTSCYQVTWRAHTAEPFFLRAWKRPGLHAQREPCCTKFWQRCDDGWTVDGTTSGGWKGSRAMQLWDVVNASKGTRFFQLPSAVP